MQDACSPALRRLLLLYWRMSGKPPAPQRHKRPDGFDQPKWPCALQKAVDGTQNAHHGESQYKPRAALLQCVADQHCCDGKQTEESETIHAIFLKEKAYFEHAAGLIWIHPGRTERVTRCEAGCPNKGKVPASEEALVLKGRRQSSGP